MICTKCGEDKPEEQYGRNGKYIRKHCKTCEVERVTHWRKDNPNCRQGESKGYRERNRSKYNAMRARQRAEKRQAKPNWFDKEEVDYIYQLAKDKNLEVDHIVPLKHEMVCGLHVQDNLRCIPATLNRHKGNRYWSDMWED